MIHSEAIACCHDAGLAESRLNTKYIYYRFKSKFFPLKQSNRRFILLFISSSFTCTCACVTVSRQPQLPCQRCPPVTCDVAGHLLHGAAPFWFDLLPLSLHPLVYSLIYPSIHPYRRCFLSSSHPLFSSPIKTHPARRACL